jgi:hypothetical protein
MPIKDLARYPPHWKEISKAIRARAGNRCEGSPKYPDCRAFNGKPHPVTGSRVVLTVAHIDHDPGNCEPDNLRAWCQRCHLTSDARHHAKTRHRRACVIRHYRQPALFEWQE